MTSWQGGGYFASMIRYPPGVTLPVRGRDDVFEFSLREHTQKQFRALALADSITIDPHKAGYVPYPAYVPLKTLQERTLTYFTRGGLCYKDGRMRQLLTWSAPYLNQGGAAESIGIYGIEGRCALPILFCVVHGCIIDRVISANQAPQLLLCISSTPSSVCTSAVTALSLVKWSGHRAG